MSRCCLMGLSIDSSSLHSHRVPRCRETTLALALIRSGELKDAVLIVNDFGDASFDSVQVGATGTAYRAMDGGCICCTVKDDLLRTLHEIPSLFPDKASVWIETSGISNPSDLIPLFEGSSFLSRSYSLRSVVAVVDVGTALTGCWRKNRPQSSCRWQR